jgi:GTP-binding protein EngB required for normal cell division
MESERIAAERMLERRRPLEAREHARAILAKVPDSPLGLALWADAAEAAWLDHEAVESLEALAQQVPWRADVWLRLGRVGLRVGYPHARDALERAASAPDERAAARRALLDLADLDLAAGDPARALRWIERIPVGLASTKDEAATLRRAEILLAMGREAEAAELAESLTDTLGESAADPTKDEEREPGRRALLRARLAWMRGDPNDKKAGDGEPTLGRASALLHALRAFILDVPGAREMLATIVSFTRDAKTLAEVRAIVAGAGQFEEPSLMAAFAFAEGRRADARAALVRAVQAGDAVAAPALARLAVETRDAGSIAALLEFAPNAAPPALPKLFAANDAVLRGAAEEALRLLDEVDGDAEAEGWADELREKAYGAFLREQRADWPKLLDVLLTEARQLGQAKEMLRVEALGAELDRPIVLAIVGEFNAGKSTFINAFLGVDVAPTGILPTTATLHRVAWAADRFARVLLRGAPDRIVSHDALKATLGELQKDGQSPIDRVQIYAPIERLRWVEILDTPGFNAPNPEHARAAMSAFDEVHAVVWLLDATGPLKASEAAILKQVNDRGLPVIVLLNKLDRLAPADLERVVEHTRAGLAEIGLSPAAGPLPFSAKLALAGRLGDAAALERSRWTDVEAVLSSEVVDRADVLRESALRRRAGRVALDLAAHAGRETARLRSSVEERFARAALLRAAARPLLDRPDEAVARADGELDLPVRALLSDLRPLAQIAEGARDEATIAYYAAPRAIARLSGPVCDVLGRKLGVGPVALAPAFVAVALEGCVVGGAVAQDLGERLTSRLLRAAVRAFAAAMLEEASDLEAKAPRPKTERRLGALAAALGSASAAAPAGQSVETSSTNR